MTGLLDNPMWQVLIMLAWCLRLHSREQGLQGIPSEFLSSPCQGLNQPNGVRFGYAGIRPACSLSSVYLLCL